MQGTILFTYRPSHNTHQLHHPHLIYNETIQKMNTLKRTTSSAMNQKMNDEPVGELFETKSIRKRNKARPTKNLESMLDISSSGHTIRTEEGSNASNDFDIQSVQTCPTPTSSARSTRILAPITMFNGLPTPYSPVKRKPTRKCSASIVSPVSPMTTFNGLPTPYSPAVKRTPTRKCSARKVSPVSPMTTFNGLPIPCSPAKSVEPGRFKNKNWSRGVARAHSSNVALMRPTISSPIKKRRRGKSLTDFLTNTMISPMVRMMTKSADGHLSLVGKPFYTTSLWVLCPQCV